MRVSVLFTLSLSLEEEEEKDEQRSTRLEGTGGNDDAFEVAIRSAERGARPLREWAMEESCNWRDP